MTSDDLIAYLLPRAQAAVAARLAAAPAFSAERVKLRLAASCLPAVLSAAVKAELDAASAAGLLPLVEMAMDRLNAAPKRGNVDLLHVLAEAHELLRTHRP